MAYSKMVSHLMNKKPSDTKEKNIDDFYRRVYPKIADDFVHILDFAETLNQIKEDILKIKQHLKLDSEGSINVMGMEFGIGGSITSIKYSQEKARALIVRKGQLSVDGTTAKEDQKIGTRGSGKDEIAEFEELLDPENPVAD